MAKRDINSFQQLDFFDPLDLQLKEADGNRHLVQYGILQEASDYRVHIGYKTQFLFIFLTEAGRQAVRLAEFRNWKPLPASVDGRITTAMGYAIPMGMIEDLKEILIPLDIHRRYTIHEFESTTTKGQKAVQITVEMLKAELIPIPVKINTNSDESVQIEGTDIIINSFLRLQVKCDYKAGDKRRGGTGNLFLQTEECNPYKFI